MERIKKVSKSYWLIVLLLAVSSIYGEWNILRITCWCVVIGYLCVALLALKNTISQRNNKTK